MAALVVLFDGPAPGLGMPSRCRLSIKGRPRISPARPTSGWTALVASELVEGQDRGQPLVR